MYSSQQLSALLSHIYYSHSHARSSVWHGCGKLSSTNLVIEMNDTMIDVSE